MDPELLPSLGDFVKCSNCGSSCSVVAGSSSNLYLPSVKRKYDEFEEGNRFYIPGIDLVSNPKVQIKDERAALCEIISGQQQTIQNLQNDLEEERNASSSAANEAISMILRLQREKAEDIMEARQFKSFAEDKMAHDQQEIYELEDLLYKREQVLQSLTYELQASKHKLLSYGVMDVEDIERDRDEMNENLDTDSSEFQGVNYPPLKCNSKANLRNLEYEDDDIVDNEKRSVSAAPNAQDDLTDLEYRILMEKTPQGNQLDEEFYGTKSVWDEVMVGHSADGSNSFMRLSEKMVSDCDTGPPGNVDNCIPSNHCVPGEDPSSWSNTDNASEVRDDTSDRVYTVDCVYNEVPCCNVAETTPKEVVSDDYRSAPVETFNSSDAGAPDVKKLYARVQALEADRESLRQALISMQTDEAQIVLLKEIAQKLCKEMSTERQLPSNRLDPLVTFSFVSIFQWVMSLIFWTRKDQPSKYSFGLSASNVGLLMLLDNRPHGRRWRCLSRTQVLSSECR